MGTFTQAEVKKNKKFYIVEAVGGIIFLIGLSLLVFGRSYNLDGTRHDLFLVFSVIFMVIGFTAALVPFILQMRMYFKVKKRADYMDSSRFAGGRQAVSAAGQAYSYYPPQVASPASTAILDPRFTSQPQQFSAAAMMQYSGSQDALAGTYGTKQMTPDSTMQGGRAAPPPTNYQQHKTAPPSHYNTGYSSQI